MKRLLLYLRGLMQPRHLQLLAEAELEREAAARKFGEQVRAQKEHLDRTDAILASIGRDDTHDVPLDA